MNHPIRFSRLGYVELQVADLTKSTEFYRDLVGMTVAREADGVVWLRCSDKPYDLILKQGDEAGFKVVGFEVENGGELDKAYTFAKESGFDPVLTSNDDLATMQVDAAFRFVDPVSGSEIDFYAGQNVESAGFTPTVAKIARLGHAVLNVTSLDKALEFWVDKLGFSVSDRVPGVVSWLRCWPNPLHHSFALAQGETNSVHHLAFMVEDIDDIGAAKNRMINAKVPIVFGPGRHLPSTSIFFYFLDPDGNTVEYSFGMEEFAEKGSREARELEAKAEVMDIWGSTPDPRFAKGVKVIQAV